MQLRPQINPSDHLIHVNARDKRDGGLLSPLAVSRVRAGFVNSFRWHQGQSVIRVPVPGHTGECVNQSEHTACYRVHLRTGRIHAG